MNSIIRDFYSSQKALIVVTAYVRYTTGDYREYIGKGKAVAADIANNLISRGVSTKRIRMDGSCYKGQFDKNKYATLIDFIFDYASEIKVTIRFSDARIYGGPSMVPYSPQDIDESNCLIESKYG